MTSRSTRARAIPRKGAWIALLILLMGWGLRLCQLQQVPPGWRDDELINIHVISGQPLAGRFPLYFTDASGHEPLYHYLHAGIHAVLGFNVLSGHILSVALGTLTLALTYALGRRLFQGQAVALIATTAMATSFWSLMYSRTAIRHMSLPPFALAVVWLLPIWQPARSIAEPTGLPPRRNLRRWAVVGLLSGISLYTYPAARLLPVLLIVLALYLFLFHRPLFIRHWTGFVLSLTLAIVIALPLGIAIARGTSEAAAEGIGADARLAELAVPMQELANGNPRPLLQNISGTLGMFHATGDPEWLYNIPNRPAFNILGGMLLWAGVAFSLLRWREPRFFSLLVWFCLGLLPAFVSVPPASLSHTILALPVAYLFPAIVVAALFARAPQLRGPARIWLFGATTILLGAFLITNAYRDLHDYFKVWPERGMVRFLYRAEYRDTARYLNAHPEIKDVGVASRLMGPWDRVALDVDVQDQEVAVRLFNPERALVIPAARGNDHSFLIVPDDLNVQAQLEDIVTRAATPISGVSVPLHTFSIDQPERAWALAPSSCSGAGQRFAIGLALADCVTFEESTPADGLPDSQMLILLTQWDVWQPLQLPAVPLIANPPPPGIYSGPRLSVFVHLVAADGTFISSDDGLWVDPATLRLGDRFIQIHFLHLPDEIETGAFIEMGLYDPMTGARWEISDADSTGVLDDRISVPIEVNR